MIQRMHYHFKSFYHTHSQPRLAPQFVHAICGIISMMAANQSNSYFSKL